MAAIFAIAPFAIDAYLPAFPTIAAEFGVDPVQINFTMSAYFIGLALGQLLGGPLSDQVGRKPIGQLGLMIFFVMTLIILSASSVQQLVVYRVIQALGGGLASSVVMPTIRDASAPEKAASRMAVVFLIMLTAPLVAPIIGVLLLTQGWRFIFVFLALYSGMVFIGYFLAIKETRISSRKSPDFAAIFRQYRQVISHRMDGQQVSIRYAMASALAGGLMMIYLTNASFVFQTYFAIEIRWFPALFATNVLFVAVAQTFSARYLKNSTLVQTGRYHRTGQRLQLTCVSLLLVSVLFFNPPLWLFMLLLASSLGCIGLISPSCAGLYLAGFKKLSGSASAILTVGMFSIGSVFGGISGLFNSGDLIPLALALFTASLLANILIWSIPVQKEADILRRLAAGDIDAL